MIVGPTAVGKTQMGVDLALCLRGEIVSADSMQVYRGLDIGTAKPTPEERKGVPHHLIDVCDPDRRFNVAEYRDAAHKAIREIHSRDRLPILAGGTGLYVKAVLDEFLFPDEGADYDLRRRLEAAARERGVEWLHGKLKQVDPGAAVRIHPNDIRRVVRALEVYETTGTPLTTHLETKSSARPPYRVAMVGLTRPRETLYARINERVDKQIEDGLIAEVRGLLERYGDLPVAGQALGYKEIAMYLGGDISLTEAIELLKRDTRRFAKRQFTWFKRDERIRWFDLDALTPYRRALRCVETEIRKRLTTAAP